MELKFFPASVYRLKNPSQPIISKFASFVEALINFGMNVFTVIKGKEKVKIFPNLSKN